MMMRSGRMRKAFLTRSRCVISPLPSIFGGRVSIRATWLLLKLKLSGILDRYDPFVLVDIGRHGVEKCSFACAGTARDQDVAPALYGDRQDFRDGGGILPISTRRDMLIGTFANLRMESERAIDGERGITALTREPSASLASTNGERFIDATPPPR